MAVDIDPIFRTYNKNWKIKTGFSNYKNTFGKREFNCRLVVRIVRGHIVSLSGILPSCRLYLLFGGKHLR